MLSTTNEESDRAQLRILKDGLVTMNEGEDWGPTVDVTEVRVLARYILEVTFDTGEVKVVDVEPLIWGPAFEPILADYAYFRKVRIDPESGTIVWPDGTDISPHTLYALSKPAVPTAPVRGEALPDA